LYWTNFRLPTDLKGRTFKGLCQTNDEIKKLSEFHDFDFRKYKGKQRINKIARNLVDYAEGKTILQTLIDIKQNKTEQIGLFK
jgi:DNA (cytosine-5)-methyltransferase 1